MNTLMAEIAAINEAAADAIADEVHEFCGQCEACMNRLYQDDSTDGGVSFQNAQHISPGMAASEVFLHEREHQDRNARFAEEEGRIVILNEIAVFTSLCIECGRVIVSGGETRTQTREAPPQQSAVSMWDVFSSREI
jgi:hypothetical protein